MLFPIKTFYVYAHCCVIFIVLFLYATAGFYDLMPDNVSMFILDQVKLISRCWCLLHNLADIHYVYAVFIVVFSSVHSKFDTLLYLLLW